MQHVCSVAQGGVDVVRDHDDCDVIAEVHELDEVIQFPRRHGVEPRDRLVEQQELARGAQGAREQHALLLAAGERLIAVVRQILDAHALHVLLRAGAVGPRIEWAAVHLVDAARAHDLRHACGKVALELRLLRQIADLVAHEPVSERDAALLRRFEPEQALDECGLAGTVFADHAQQIAARDREVHVAQHRLPVVAEADVFTSNECHN